MESYRLQQDCVKPEYTKRVDNNGTYGLSIRVKGIDGHPYVVMNNQNNSPDSNGNIGKDSFINDCNEYNFREGTETAPENLLVEKQVVKSRNGAKKPSEPQKSSSLRIIKRDPDPAKPFEKCSLSLNRHRSLPQNRTPAVEKTAPPKASSTTVNLTSPSLDEPKTPEPPMAGEEAQPCPKGSCRPQTLPVAKNQNRPPSQIQAQPQAHNQPPAKTQNQPPAKTQNQPPAKTQPEPQIQPKAPAVGRALRDSAKLPAGPPNAVSSDVTAEHCVRKPDVLPPVRRRDSCGPASLPSRSRRSSACSAPDRPLLLPDEEALSADSINRHENRRYIPFLAGTGRDIDKAPIPSVDELITKFDGNGGTVQRRGRAGRRNRINPEDRKRSRSVDSFLPSGPNEEYLDWFNRSLGRRTEHVLRPSLLGLQKSAHHQGERSPEGDCSSPESPPGTVCNGLSSVLRCNQEVRRSSTLRLRTKTFEEEKPSSRSVKVLTTATTPKPSSKSGGNEVQLDTARDTRVTPDLLKGQQDASQETNEETARQILFNYLKDGSRDNDDATKRKVNLVFEKIQTLRSRAAATDNPPNAAAETKALQDIRVQLESDVAELTKRLAEESKKQRSLVEAAEKAGADTKDLEKKLRSSQDECRKLQERLSKAEAELRSSLEELFQVKMEREQCESEIRDLQDQLSEMHDELDCAKKSPTCDAEREAIIETIMQLKMELEEALVAKEAKEEVLRRRERELTALKGALKEEVSSHDQEVDAMKEQYEQEIHKLRSSVEEAKQVSSSACREKAALEVALGTAGGRASQLSQDAERLRQHALELEREVAKLNRIIDEAKLQESRLEERVGRLEKEKRQLEASLEEAREQEEETSHANRTLATRFDDLQRNMTNLSQEYDELSDRLREESMQKELLKKTKNQVEEERRLLDRTVEKLQKAMGEVVEASQASTHDLQVQINEYKDKNRQDMNELQRQLRDKDLEQEKARLASRMLQAELSQLEENLRECKRERDEAVLMGQDLKQRLYDLEVELETRSHCKDDRSRQIKLMEDRISQLEQDLEDERLSGDELMDRVSRGREQVEHVRNELLQERAARQDLECDKMALERRNKDLKSRLAHLEGSQKVSKEGLVSQLESRILELEDRLEAEERDRANLLQANRKLDRKVKDMALQSDDERQSQQDQKDQLNLKLKALKRQMDETEEEMERLEHGRKKLQRDLEEQVEANEQLQGQLSALRSEIRRKSSAAPFLTRLDEDEDDDDVSTDGEYYYRSASLI